MRLRTSTNSQCLRTGAPRPFGLVRHASMLNVTHRIHIPVRNWPNFWTVKAGRRQMRGSVTMPLKTVRFTSAGVSVYRWWSITWPSKSTRWMPTYWKSKRPSHQSRMPSFARWQWKCPMPARDVRVATRRGTTSHAGSAFIARTGKQSMRCARRMHTETISNSRSASRIAARISLVLSRSRRDSMKLLFHSNCGVCTFASKSSGRMKSGTFILVANSVGLSAISYLLSSPSSLLGSLW
mmetsp:Transcript_102373/g.285242  ORF Transcript_102373/g.285242 Transcript_102373/m.285242 type:complete len:238 (+) Transcript_102373:204-917(+)